MTESCELGLREAAEQIRAGSLTPRDLLESCLERARVREPTVHAWELLDEAGARAQAKTLEERSLVGPLHGIPVAVKDIIDVAGLPTRCGSPIRDNTPAATDAWITTRLRAAGAIILGKTVTTEFAYFTPGKTRNPHDPTRTPGGSSSGSAAAVADRMVPLGLASQTAASTTRPAAYCGITGLITTPGRYDTSGVVGLSASLDSLGLLTRTVDDACLAAQALLDVPAEPEFSAPPALRLCSGEAFGEVEEEMGQAVAATAERCLRAGSRLATLEPTQGQRDLVAAHATVMAVEASHSLRVEAAMGGLSESLQALLDQGRATSAETYEAALAKATSERHILLEQLDGFDAVLAPAAPGAAPMGMATGSPTFSRPWQVLGLPSLTLPGARDRDGMPLGLQVIGRPGGEGHLLAVARWLVRWLSD